MSNVPKLRFKEFSGDWESKKLGNISDIYDGTHQTPKYTDSGVKFVSVENINNIYKGHKYISEEDYNKNFKIKPQLNDIFMTRITAGEIGATALVDREEDLAYYVSVALIRAYNKKVNSLFLTKYISSKYFKRELNKRIIHVAFPKKINLGDIGDCGTKLPKLEEQEKIASFFSLIDDKISLQGEKVEMLKSYKKGMMQKIFSRELRFKDDCGMDYPDWKTHLLGKSIILYDNLRKPVKEQERSSGKYAYYGATGIIDYINDYIFEGEYLLLGEDGANIVTRNAPLIYKTNGKFWVNNHAHIFKPTSEFDIDFMKQCLERINYVPYNTGTAQPKLNVESIKSIPFKAPTLEEQKKIAKLLIQIDLKVEKEQVKLDSLNEYKRGLLQQMFI